MRKKTDWQPLAPPILTRLMKSLSLILASLLILGLWHIQVVRTLDLATLPLMIAGAGLVRAAKKELTRKKAFTWTGYALENPQLVTSGIYAYLRHPLYTGVYLVEIAGAAVVFPRYQLWFPRSAWILLVCSSVGLGYAMIFNAVLASRESKVLQSLFGQAYTDYSKRVRAFWPFRIRG